MDVSISPHVTQLFSTEGLKKVAVLSKSPCEKVKLTHTPGPYLPKATEREKSE